MSVDSLLDAAFTTLLGKAHQEFEAAAEAPAVRPATININFSGGGSALSVGKPCMLRIPFPCVIYLAEIYAGNEQGLPVNVTCTVDVWLTSILSFTAGGQTPIYGATRPGLTAASSATIDISNWLVNLMPTDRLMARIATWSGAATWLALLLQVIPTGVPQGSATVVDESGNTVVDAFGNTVVFRN